MAYFDLNLDEPRQHPFVVSLDIRGKIFNNFDDLCDKLYVANKSKNVNVKVHNTTIRINKSKALVKHISCGCRSR